MRVEATIPDARAKQLDDVARDLTPALSQLEWHALREKVTVSDAKALGKALAAEEPTPALKRVMGRRRK